MSFREGERAEVALDPARGDRARETGPLTPTDVHDLFSKRFEVMNEILSLRPLDEFLDAPEGCPVRVCGPERNTR